MLSALRNPARLRELSVGLRQDLVKACYDQQMRDEGTELLADLIRTAGDDRTLESTRAVLRSRGLDQVSREVEAQVQAEVKSLVSTGAAEGACGRLRRRRGGDDERRAQDAGQPARAVQRRARPAAPYREPRLERGLREPGDSLIERAQRLSPANPRLTAITEFMHELMKRFGIAAGRTPPKPRQA